MFIEALFVIAKIWKQPSCPSVGEWINKCGTSIQQIIFSNENKLSSHAKTWKNLKCILLTERSQSERAVLCDSNYMTFWKRQNYEDSKKQTNKKAVVARSLGGGRERERGEYVEHGAF